MIKVEDMMTDKECRWQIDRVQSTMRKVAIVVNVCTIIVAICALYYEYKYSGNVWISSTALLVLGFSIQISASLRSKLNFLNPKKYG